MTLFGCIVVETYNKDMEQKKPSSSEDVAQKRWGMDFDRSSQEGLNPQLLDLRVSLPEQQVLLQSLHEAYIYIPLDKIDAMMIHRSVTSLVRRHLTGRIPVVGQVTLDDGGKYLSVSFLIDQRSVENHRTITLFAEQIASILELHGSFILRGITDLDLSQDGLTPETSENDAVITALPRFKRRDTDDT